MQDTILRCPICRMPLVFVPHAEGHGGSYQCAKRHTFDRARQGYTNLLTGRAAGQHGDNTEMIAARRAFLDGGYYAPLCATLIKAVEAHLPHGGTLLDAGCGEGYYTDACLRAVADRDVHGWGIDISREALKCACQREAVKSGLLALFAAGVYEMPFADDAFDMVLNFFAPLATAEYLRVLKEDGILVMAIPAARHLWEMKEVLYDIPRENEVADFALDGFTLLSETRVTCPMQLPDPATIAVLFSMTPYYYRTPAVGKAKLASLPSLSVTADFHLLVYRRASATRAKISP